MENALKDTYGVIVYQEQVMQVARDLAGYSRADADKLRKIMGKKQKDEMTEQKNRFVNGAVLGNIKVELEDGTTKVVHRASKFMCVDGVKRTVEEAMKERIEIASLT
jgi:DNA polymerase-3 subunit alpha